MVLIRSAVVVVGAVDAADHPPTCTAHVLHYAESARRVDQGQSPTQDPFHGYKNAIDDELGPKPAALSMCASRERGDQLADVSMSQGIANVSPATATGKSAVFVIGLVSTGDAALGARSIPVVHGVTENVDARAVTPPSAVSGAPGVAGAPGLHFAANPRRAEDSMKEGRDVTS